MNIHTNAVNRWKPPGTESPSQLQAAGPARKERIYSLRLVVKGSAVMRGE
jgi:hypothetical protein